MAGAVDVNAPNTQNPAATANGGALDTQGRYTFGGITTTGVGGKTSTNDINSYVAMAVIAAVVVGLAFVFFKHR